MASKTYNPGRRRFLLGLIDWANDDIRCLLVQPAYTFDADHEFVSDVVAAELSATDYVRKALAGRSVGVGAPTFALADNPLWAGLGGAVNQTIHGLVVFVHTGNDATAPLICFVDPTDLITQNIDVEFAFANQRVFTWSDA